MGRLFWKFFFFCLLAQMLTIVGVTTAIALRNRALAAFDAAARGDLDVRLGSRMGGQRDELADLGRHFDRLCS